MKTLLTITSFAGILFSATAYATPGDMGCSGMLGKDKVEVLIGYDNFGEGPSLLEVSLGKKKVISATTVDEKIVNIGSEDRPIIVNAIAGIDQIDSVAEVYFIKNHGNGTKDALLTFNVTDGLSAEKIKITCEI